jgi:peptidoglycan/LPS O-acetylase OafA/YrhL
MNKPLFGLVLGGLLGILDGMSAWFTPDARPQMVSIIIGSTFKGLIAGVLIGWFARKVNSLPAGIVFGLTVGLLLAFAVAAMPSPTGKHYYFEIMLPGAIVGAIVGYATQKHRGAVPAKV